MGVIKPGKHQLMPNSYPDDASRIAFKSKVLLVPALGILTAGAELFDSAVSAAFHQGEAVNHLIQAGEAGAVAVAAVAALDTAEHWLIANFKQ